MQVCDAQFSPVATKKRGSPVLKIGIVILCALVLLILAIRVFGWVGQRQETELLVLVNPWNGVETSGFSPKLTDIGNGHQADRRCVEDLEQMLADCEAAGYSPYICSSYRTQEYQQQLFDNKVQRLIAEGEEEQQAYILAAQVVAVPGTSEHQLGLAFDIVDESYQVLDEAQADTPAQKWLVENSWRYGFILRYPQGSTEVTGIIYEPWHYRYVGRAAAEQINQLGLTLEEYISMFYSEQAVIIFQD